MCCKQNSEMGMDFNGGRLPDNASPILTFNTSLINMKYLDQEHAAAMAMMGSKTWFR